MFATPAFAQAGGAAGGFDPGVFVPLILIFVVFYFLLIRPQQKKMKQHRDMVANLRRGDQVVTSGGIIGTITRVSDDKEIQVEIAQGVRVRVARNTVAEVLSKSEPAANDDKGGSSEGKPRGGGKGKRASRGDDSNN